MCTGWDWTEVCNTQQPFLNFRPRSCSSLLSLPCTLLTWHRAGSQPRHAQLTKKITSACLRRHESCALALQLRRPISVRMRRTRSRGWLERPCRGRRHAKFRPKKAGTSFPLSMAVSTTCLNTTWPASRSCVLIRSALLLGLLALPLSTGFPCNFVLPLPLLLLCSRAAVRQN